MNLIINNCNIIKNKPIDDQTTNPMNFLDGRSEDYNQIYYQPKTKTILVLENKIDLGWQESKERGQMKEIESDLALTYEERAFLNLAQLGDELLQEDAEFDETGKWDKHRIYRHNNFEEVDIRLTRRCEKYLKYALSCLGHYIDTNIIEIAKEHGQDINVPADLENFSQHSSISSVFLGPELRKEKSMSVVDRKTRANIVYDKRGVLHLKAKKHIKFSANRTRQPLMLSIVAKALKLIGTDNYMTQRELYYKCLQFCRVKKHPSPMRPGQTQNCTENRTQNQPSQHVATQTIQDDDYKHTTKNLEMALNDICCLVGCSKIHLHIIPQVKGLVYGNMKLKFKNGVTVDCLTDKKGTKLPMSNETITSIETDARFIMILEKDSVMQKILDQEDKTKFLSKFKAILVTGKGYPDWNTKLFVNYLWSKLNIPILALTDADPHGVEIVCTYKFGCLSTAYDGSMIATPQMKWLGLLPSDVLRMAIPNSKTHPQTGNDLAKLNSLLDRKYIRDRPDWAEQLMLMRTMNRKAEIECLEGEFLVNTYLPNKLKYASWL